MKNYLCVLMSALLAVGSTSCSVERKDNHRPAPATPATQEQIEQTEQKFEDQGNKQAEENGQGDQAYSKSRAYLDTAVQSLIKNSDMRLKDYEGKDLTLDEYKANPTEGFVLFAEADGYSVLKTSVDLNAVKNSTGKVDFTYQAFKMDGEMDDFAGDDLGAPELEEALTVNTKNALSNKSAIDDLIKRVNGAQFAYNTGAFEQMKNFLFPTAYADTKDSLLITAIVFTSIAVLSYIFAFYPIGDISTAVAIVFWLLYAFED